MMDRPNVYINGEYRPMDDKQFAEYQNVIANIPKPDPDPIQKLSEKVDTVESKIDDLNYIITGEVTANAQ